MDGPGHLLSLKVMRVSRPALASAWEPFYSNSPSFSAHSTASVLSLQGSTPLAGHPKTLRDLTNAAPLLTLPSSFGAIQLGETFAGALAVNNESAAAVDGVVLRVEMQTASGKALLAELGGATMSLAAGDTLETMVQHEIKELGQHVLACTVSYQLPPGARRPAPVPAPAGAGVPDATGGDTSLQTFRKFYKFAVTNPLSVKTKVHVPRAPSALLSAEERTKVFLEVHIQNLTAEPMWFERMLFEPAPGWYAQDANVLPGGAQESLFSGPAAMMQPQDMRQYIYILSEAAPPSIPAQHAPGTVLPLGRLDISWRSSFGEPGRLLTSMLSRRIPPAPSNQAPARSIQQQPSQQPASALPLHLQRTATVAGTPSQPPSRASTPPIGPAPYRPASPFRNRPTSVPPGRPQSPVTFSAAGSALAAPPPHEPLDVDLVVRAIPRGALRLNAPFRVACALGVAAPVRSGQQRTLRLAVQHVQLPTAASPSSLSSTPTPALAFPPTPTQTPRPPPRTPPALLDGPLLGSPRTATQFLRPAAHEHDNPMRPLPRPVPVPGDEARYARLSGARFLGASALLSEPLVLAHAEGAGDDDRAEAFWEFEFEYVPVQTGFVRVGGLRVVLLEDQLEGVGATEEFGEQHAGVRTLREWDVIGEIWVKS
ncbi:hypothetical protein BC834DRAFT_816742 [Gloeopeniophorella convolvens]|nr:hypothetical protein BC834DRAFT_816742 [Gloeopeniophorella convolvens]